MFSVWMVCMSDASEPGYELLPAFDVEPKHGELYGSYLERVANAALKKIKSKWEGMPGHELINNAVPCSRANIPAEVWEKIPESIRKYLEV